MAGSTEGNLVRRPGAVLSALALSAVGWVGVAPQAEATATAACAISGTINFSPLPTVATQGTWSIEPAVISCQGVFRAYDRITGPSEFTGSGTYVDIGDGPGSCMQHVGSGEVDYVIKTPEADVRINEPHEFVLAGAGTFATPSLKGSLQVSPPYEGDCVTSPVTRATFLAQGLFVRVNGVDR